MARIIAAAINVKMVTLSMPPPFRHHDIVQRARRIFGEDFDHEQGFVTDDGTFVSRVKAKEIAEKAGQLKPRMENQYQGRQLFSEDLW